MNHEDDATITIVRNTNGPAGVMTGVAGNQRSHRARSPVANDSRSAGSFGSRSGRNNANLLRNQDIDPNEPTPSAITVAGIAEKSANNCRTRTSNASSAERAGGLEYDGGLFKTNPFVTVSRAIPDASRSL